jgi:hypothetical protein
MATGRQLFRKVAQRGDHARRRTNEYVSVLGDAPDHAINVDVNRKQPRQPGKSAPGITYKTLVRANSNDDALIVDRGWKGPARAAPGQSGTWKVMK